MSYQNIVFAIHDGIAELTLNRPDRLNAFNQAMHAEVRDAMGNVRADRSVRVLVLTGAGRSFCAGHDASERAPGADSPRADLGDAGQRNYAPLVLALRALPIPVICAVNGVASGAGVNLALACDIVLAGRSATFSEMFCKLGLIPDTGGTYFLPRLLGSARAMGVAMLGGVITAEQAEQWGMIWRCLPDNVLAAETMILARQLACAPTKALGLAKQALYASAANTLEQQLALECSMMSELGMSDDYCEGMNALQERRHPAFKGH